MTDLYNASVTQAPLGARLPRFLQAAQGVPAGGAPAYGTDQLNINGPTGGNGADPAAIQQQLQSPNPADRFRAVVSLTNMPPAQAIPLLQLAAQNDNPQVRDLAAQALNVMQRMPGTQPQQPGVQPQQPGYQPQPQQPGYQPQQPGGYQPQQPGYQPQPQPQQPPYNGYQPQAQPPVTYQPPVGPANINPADAEFMVQTLAPDLMKDEATALNAVRQLAAIAQSNPNVKEPVFNLLLNHIYHRYDNSVGEAMQAVAAMDGQRALPYIENVQRKHGYDPMVHDTAVRLIKQLRQQQGGPGTASVNGVPGASVEMIRAMEFELGRGDAQARQAAFAQIRNALGPDPRANSPLRQEVIRVLLTHIATKYDETVGSACQLLGQMGAREMDTLRYLDAVKRKPGMDQATQQAAAAAIQQIMAMPPTR